MGPDELRAIMGYLESRVGVSAGETGVTITFESPTEHQLVEHGLDADGVRQILTADWWGEMIDDVIETPEFCGPDESPDAILGYARDVITEYIRKRFQLE